MSGYDDIINMPHHVSEIHPHMSMQDRAAQFSPFAALTGHGDAVKETARLTDEKLELTEDEISGINQKLNFLTEHAEERPKITVEYFVPDERKSGGAYITVMGNFRRIAEAEGHLILTNGDRISLNDISRIDGNIFDEMK